MTRLTILTLVVCLIGLAAAAHADEIYVPKTYTSNNHQNNYPFNPSAHGEWRYQLVASPAQLGRQPFSVTDLWFLPSGNGGLLCSLLEVRMSHTTVKPSTLFAVNLPNPTTVFTTTNAGWATSAGKWSPMGLQNLFHYDGKSGLTIEIRYTGGTLRGSFRGTCTGMNTPHGAYRIGKQATGSYSAASGTNWGQTGLAFRLTAVRATVTPSGTGKIGTTLLLNLSAPGEAGLPYQAGSSLGAGPIKIGTWSLPLSIDGVLELSVGNLVPGLFVGYSGKLDAQGAAQAKINIPNLTILKGVRIHTAFVTIDLKKPFGISQVSPLGAVFTIG